MEAGAPMTPVYPYRTGQPGPTVVVMQAAPTIICDRYAAKSSVGIGIALIIIGILCAIFNGVLYVTGADAMKYYGHGFWSAFMFVITGFLGIASGRSKTRGSITTFLVMTILSACCSVALFVFSIIGALYARQYTSCSYNRYDYYRSCANNYDVAVALESMLVICSVVAGILSILGSVICCKSTCLCCGATPVSPGVVLPANCYPGIGQMMYISQAPSTNYFYSLGTPQQSLVGSEREQTNLGQVNWNQPPSMPENGLAYQELLPSDPPPSYSYYKP